MNEINNNQVNGAYDPYETAQQPAYQQPQQPAYQQPQQPAYQQPQQPAYQQPQQPAYQQPQQPVYDPYAQQPVYGQIEPVNDSATLIFGIIAIVCACTFYLSVGGIIFGAIAKHKAKYLIENNGQVGGTVKTGKILGTIGFILGIVFTSILAIVILASLSA